MKTFDTIKCTKDCTSSIKRDCMPDVLLAIHCVEKGDMAGAARANKCGLLRSRISAGMSVYDASSMMIDIDKQ